MRPGLHHGAAFVSGELPRRQPALGDRLRRRPDRLPLLRAGLQILFGQWAHALHRGLRRRFAAAMGKLNADRAALPPHESDQRLEAFDLGVVPEPEIVLVDEADFLHTGRLDEYEAEPAEGITPEMHHMEGAAGVAGIGAIMHHRWHHE